MSGSGVSAAFVPSYCLAWCTETATVFKIPRLSSLSEESILRAVLLYVSGKVDRIIFSTAYGEWESTIERNLKIELLMEHGVPRDAIDVIAGITNSYNEASGAKAFIEKADVTKLYVVAERWHRFRAVKTFKILFPHLEIKTEWFKPRRWEITEEPSGFKAFRAAVPPLWILWNLLFLIPTPAIAHMIRRSWRRELLVKTI